MRGVSGSVEVGLTFRPRFEYGLTTPYITELADDLVVATGSADALLLESEIGPLPRDGRGGVDARDLVGAGEERVISITWSTPSGLDTSRIGHAEAVAELDSTVRFWQTWSAHTRYDGPYREAVERSALAIKGLTDGKTGAVIAAASTSLPETIGGSRNWDYRYTWVRDSTTMLNALIRLGHDYECRRFSEWIREHHRRSGVRAADHVRARRRAHPHRDRVAAPLGLSRLAPGPHRQRSLEPDAARHLRLADGLDLVHRRHTRASWDSTATRTTSASSTRSCELAIDEFDVVDEGIWEVRGGAQHFLFSKLLMWLAVDLGIRLVEEHDGADAVPGPWRVARDEMRHRIETEGVDPARGVFTQAFGSTALDASALQIPNVGFLPADDPRVLATIEAIDRELGLNGHIYRYRNDDGLEGEEGTFVFCTLWMVSALAQQRPGRAGQGAVRDGPLTCQRPGSAGRGDRPAQR